MKKKLLTDNYLKSIRLLYPVIKAQTFENEINLIINSEILTRTLFFFKFHYLYQFKILTCISGVDYPEKKYRFKLVYELLSLRYNNRLKLKIFINELKPAYSVTKIFPSAEWFEAEIWDMFGVFFYKHYNLIRLLTDYGFEGFPFRKNFPLSGYVESRYNEFKKTVVREIIELNQEYRNFRFLSIWERQNS